MSVRIHIGDCREVMKGMAAGSVHMVATSPPYYGLRSYGVGTENGEIGLDHYTISVPRLQSPNVAISI